MARAISATGAMTVGSVHFDPDEFFVKWANKELGPPVSPENDFRGSIITAFSLKESDNHVYHAVASVTLAQVQAAINHGGNFGLQAWYLDTEGKQTEPPPASDIDAYIAIFSSATSTSKALTAYQKNAKKNSLRASIANHLLINRDFPAQIIVPKLKQPHINPYFDFWSWSCRALNWAGPEEKTVNVKHSHHVLPVFYHHFGCVCPSFESLESIRQIAKGRYIVELGSGNGYWTYLLRRLGLTVYAVDNGDSLWRTMWISDTIRMDGSKYLKKENGCKDAVLLLVYPQVTTDFTKSVLRGYDGDSICIAGTQNANGFTAFQNITVEQFLADEQAGFVKVIQTPLPSFPGKDEALSVFRRKN